MYWEVIDEERAATQYTLLLILFGLPRFLPVSSPVSLQITWAMRDTSPLQKTRLQVIQVVKTFRVLCFVSL